MFIKNYRQQKQRALLIIKKGEHLTDNIFNELSASLNNCVTKLSITNAVAQFEDYCQFIEDTHHRLTDNNNKKAMISHHDIDNHTQLVQLAIATGATLLQRLLGDETTTALSNKIVLQLASIQSHLHDLYITCMQLLPAEQAFDAIETCCNLLATGTNTFISKILSPLPSGMDQFVNQLSNTLNKSLLDAFQIMIPICISIKNFQKALNYLVYFKRTLNGLNQTDADYISLEKIYLELKNKVSAIVSLLAAPPSASFTPYCDTNNKIRAVKIKISEACVKVKCQAYLFGGAIRDHHPSDLDIVIVNNSHAQNFVTLIKQTCFILNEYEKYGRHVIQANIDDCKIDFTFFDGDIKTHSTNLDFTVNALYQDLSNGNIIDPLGKGLNDLKHNIIRCIADPLPSLKTNPVRILRAIKIIAKCGFTVEESITTALTHLFNEKNYFSLINADRLYAEFINLFMRGFGYRSYMTLVKLNLFNNLFPAFNTLTDNNRDSAIQLVEFTLKFIDKAINEDHEIVPPALLYYAIHWYVLNHDFLSNPAAPLINFQYGDYPAFNPFVERCCKTFILKFLANEIDAAYHWHYAYEFQLQQDSRYALQQNNYHSHYSTLLLWQPQPKLPSIPPIAQTNEATASTSPDDHSSLKLQ